MKIGLVAPYPPVKVHQGYYALNIIKYTSCEFVKIGMKESDADYKIDFESFSLAEELRKIVEKEKLDVLHIQYIPPFFGRKTLNLNIFPVYKLNVPIVTTLHEVYFPTKGGFIKKAKESYLKKIEKHIVRHSKQVIVHNYMMKEFLEKKYKTNKVNTIVLGHEKKKVKEKKENNILFFGILSPGKGVEFLIESMKNLPEYHLTIGGSLPNEGSVEYAEKLKELAKDMKNVEIVTEKWFSMERKWKLHEKADLMVLPYVWSPYNSAVTRDAIELCIPLVVTRVGALYDLVERETLGIVTKEKSSDALTSAIKEGFKKHEVFKKNLKKFRESVSWEKNGENHLGVYTKCLS